MTLLGEAGLRRLALLNHERACDLADALAGVKGVELLTPHFFNEFAIRLPRRADAIVETLAAKGVLAGVPYARLAPQAGLDDVLLVAATETNTDDDIALYAHELKKALA
jgi:glycine dehydrogenase subunit 1